MPETLGTSPGSSPTGLAFGLWRDHALGLLICGVLLAVLNLAGTFQIVTWFPFDFIDASGMARRQMNIALFSLLWNCFLFSLFSWLVVLVLTRGKKRGANAKARPGLFTSALRTSFVTACLYLLVSLLPVLKFWLSDGFGWVVWLIFIPFAYCFIKLSGAYGWAIDGQVGTLAFFRRTWSATTGQEPSVLKLWMCVLGLLFLVFASIYTLLNFEAVRFNDRTFGTNFFDPAETQTLPIRLQHLFWFFNHTEVQLKLVCLISFSFLVTASVAVYGSTNKPCSLSAA